MQINTLSAMMIMIILDHYPFGSDKNTHFRAGNEKLLKNDNKIKKKTGSLIKRGFDCEPVYGDKYIKVKIKSYGYARNTSFQDKKNTNR